MNADGFCEFEVETGHPALAGHFPGDPIVPGVLLLSYVARAARRCLGESIIITAWPQAKFAAPLRPGERFVIRIQASASGEASFDASTRSGPIANGLLRYARGSQ